jgi:hypothetical protein
MQGGAACAIRAEWLSSTQENFRKTSSFGNS